MARRLVLACEIGIGQALAADLGHGEHEALTIVHVLAIVVSKGLLIKVAVKMKRFYAHIRSRNSALKQRPEILKAVRVYSSIHVLNGNGQRPYARSRLPVLHTRAGHRSREPRQPLRAF